MELRLQHFEDNLLYMENLVHLRYLALSIFSVGVPFKLKFFEHWNMQSFIVRECCVLLDSSEASRIWKMPLLRNFYVERNPITLEASEVVHRNIETIFWLRPECCKEDLFTRIPNLKELGIQAEMDFENGNSNAFYNFVHLGQLEKLSIRGWHLELQDRGIQWATSFLPNLKKLNFFKTGLPWSNMRLIGMLPNLEVLKLKHACQGKKWKPSEEGFRQLKRLVIESKCLEYWNAVGDHFPVLERLELSDCDSLRKIPIEFADITTLVLIQLKKCRYSVFVSALCIQDEQRSFLQESLEKSEMAYDDAGAMKDVEAEIRDAAFEAEERIEMELTSIYLAKGWTKGLRIKACLLRLHGIFVQAIKQTDYLKKKFIKIQSEKQLAKGPSQGTLSVVHRNLESIYWLDAKLCTQYLFTRIPNLKKLGIDGRLPENNLDCFYNFVHVGQLEKLSIRNWHNLHHIPCSGIPWATSFLPNLKRLKFFNTMLPWSDMRLIGMLPNLEVLKLIYACQVGKWETEGGFRQLKRLVIKGKCLEDWTAVGDNFPVLEHLELIDCKCLPEIPIAFSDITTLELIQINGCLDSVLASAKHIQDEQRSYGNEALLVRATKILRSLSILTSIISLNQ
nr:putative late blight resistance protein homolog R1A-4 [Ipomoea trifida]